MSDTKREGNGNQGSSKKPQGITESQAKRDTKGRWLPGVSPNPGGRTKGAAQRRRRLSASLKDRMTEALSESFDDVWAAILSRAITRHIPCPKCHTKVEVPGDPSEWLKAWQISQPREIEATVEHHAVADLDWETLASKLGIAEEALLDSLIELGEEIDEADANTEH